MLFVSLLVSCVSFVLECIIYAVLYAKGNGLWGNNCRKIWRSRVNGHNVNSKIIQKCIYRYTKNMLAAQLHYDTLNSRIHTKIYQKFTKYKNNTNSYYQYTFVVAKIQVLVYMQHKSTITYELTQYTPRKICREINNTSILLHIYQQENTSDINMIILVICVTFTTACVTKPVFLPTVYTIPMGLSPVYYTDKCSKCSCQCAATPLKTGII
jgi:hypothetical protein